ncbi:MAG: PAS domain-containing protein, partial [Candidatus Obscuribacterales bacterium]|nr:PAS domain-containing protein [Candidatus Obscuribacterales bacterium]
KMEAISRSNTIIEFDPQGFIVDANENFLELTEYTLPEIKGKHHQISSETTPLESQRGEKRGGKAVEEEIPWVQLCIRS